MSARHADPLDHPEIGLVSAPAAVAGTLLALLAMAVALLLTLLHAGTPAMRMAGAGCLAVVALVSQALFLFRLGLGETQIWKTVALVLVLPLFVVTIGLTDIMFHSLQARTMLEIPLHGGLGP